MTLYALLTFAVAALGGIYMTLKIFKGTLAPWGVSLIHAALGATGLLLLMLAYLKGNAGVLMPLIILVVAALGGFFLASFHLRKKAAPKSIVVIHALAAVAGVLALLSMVMA